MIIEGLRIFVLGMVGIFIVMGIISLVIQVLTHFDGRQRKKGVPPQ